MAPLLTHYWERKTSPYVTCSSQRSPSGCPVNTCWPLIFRSVTHSIANPCFPLCRLWQQTGFVCGVCVLSASTFVLELLGLLCHLVLLYITNGLDSESVCLAFFFFWTSCFITFGKIWENPKTKLLLPPPPSLQNSKFQLKIAERMTEARQHHLASLRIMDLDGDHQGKEKELITYKKKKKEIKKENYH